MRKQPLCPKCRSLGLDTDCSDGLIHAKKKRDMNPEYGDDIVEMEVTVSFMAPITSSLDLDPTQMATHMREQWIDEPATFGRVITEALNDDYDLAVRPVSGM